MTDIGETIAVAAVSKEDDAPCWYCEEPEGPNKKNDEEADPDTSNSDSASDPPENDEKNDASKLGSNIGGKPLWEITCPDKNKKTSIVAAAHHCIPGNASFKKAATLLKFIRKGGPLNLISDIGYSINHENNGVWLPGNYAVRPGKEHYTKKWGTYRADFKNTYAVRAMRKSRVQFHDAHPRYNKNVLQTLENIALKIGRPKKQCPLCGKEFDKARPPYGLVGRLDAVSAEHRSMLKTLSKKKGKGYVDAGYYTSSRVKKFFET